MRKPRNQRKSNSKILRFLTTRSVETEEQRKLVSKDNADESFDLINEEALNSSTATKNNSRSVPATTSNNTGSGPARSTAPALVKFVHL